MESPEDEPKPTARTLRGLDLVNFLMADVETGVGPFLAIYLAASLHWDPAKIGVAMSAGGLASIAAQTPMGALVDVLKKRREALAVSALMVALGCFVTVRLQRYYPIVTAQAAVGVVSAFFPPAMAGMTLGIVGARGLTRRVGRNETWNHAGNVCHAIACGLLGYWFDRRCIFYYVIAVCVITAAVVFAIRRDDISDRRARGSEKPEADGPDSSDPVSFLEALRNRSLLIFGFCVALFHFANAAMLPLIGQRLSRGDDKTSSLYMAVCIVGAQAVMTPLAMFAGKYASVWGRKAVFLIGFVALPIRGVLYTLNDHPYYLIGVQLLDGIGAGIFGVVSVLVISDLTRGSGRFNFTQGVVATATGLGASLSNVIAGFIVQHAGFNAAFLFLAAMAAIGLTVFWRWMPETLASPS